MVLRPEFVERKLQLITEDLERLGQFRSISYESLIADPLRLAAVERLLERIILRAIDVNEHIITELATGGEEKTTRLTYRDTFLKLSAYGVYDEAFAERIAPAAGLRNILVHQYNDIDHRIVFDSIGKVLELFTA
ncbi:MAG: type VII toxin-antitoxin system HepT family RNase toxin, partial [Pseudomonas sp.]